MSVNSFFLFLSSSPELSEHPGACVGRLTLQSQEAVCEALGCFRREASDRQGCHLALAAAPRQRVTFQMPGTKGTAQALCDWQCRGSVLTPSCSQGHFIYETKLLRMYFVIEC